MRRQLIMIPLGAMMQTALLSGMVKKNFYQGVKVALCVGCCYIQGFEVLLDDGSAIDTDKHGYCHRRDIG